MDILLTQIPFTCPKSKKDLALYISLTFAIALITRRYSYGYKNN